MNFQSKNIISNNYKNVLEQFSNKKILVLGDFCLDEYIYGDTNAISPEAPIPRVVIKEKKYVPGAAGNVVCGVAALGAATYAIGVIGDDTNGRILIGELKRRGINTDGLILAEIRNTATYSRIVCGGFHKPKQQMIRFDVENTEPIDSELKDKVKSFILNLIPDIDAIIVADYDEMNGIGIVSKELLDAIVPMAHKHGVKLVGDSRKQLQLFKGFTIVVPNDVEAGLAVGRSLNNEDALIETGKQLLKELKLEAIMITRGKDGISVFEPNKVSHMPTVAKEVFDVTGAGDTVTCVIILALLANASYQQAAELANYAASVTVAKEGTVAVSREEIMQGIQAKEAIQTIRRLKSREEIKEIATKLKKDKKKIVFLNGYFDPLHIGHIQLISNAKIYGDVLIVGLNSDRSVMENKGPGRPFMNQEKRIQLLGSIEAVDYLVLFDELTPIKLIQDIKPDVLIKGNNYAKDEVVGKDIVELYGGEVVLLDMIKGLSSDLILEVIKSKEAK